MGAALPDSVPDDQLLGWLLRLCAEWSDGGYVLIRRGKHQGHAARGTAWRVSLRRGGQDWISSDRLSLGRALAKALARTGHAGLPL